MSTIYASPNPLRILSLIPVISALLPATAVDLEYEAIFFSSEARGTFNMHPNPILSYIFELSGMSAITFAVPNPLQVNSVES